MMSFQNLDQTTKRELVIDGKHYLFFGGTAYLGLLDNPEYIQLYKEGIDKYGLNNGTSRSNNIQLGIYRQVEEALAMRFGFEDAALFSSGYLSAQAAVKALKEDKEIIYAPGCHPALWLDDKPQVEGSFEKWAEETIHYINNAKQDSFIVISNCIDNLRPANYDFSIFSTVLDHKQVLLLLDDSHGIAVVHKNGISSNLSLLKDKHNIEIVIVASLAKGLGTDAGVVLGTSKSLNKVKKQPIFLGASPSSPASMYALLYGDGIYSSAFDQLHKNIAYFKHRLSINNELSHIVNFPVFSSLEPSLYEYLRQNNILISSFPYPLSTSSLLNRIVISALHTESDLNYLLEKYHSKSK